MSYHQDTNSPQTSPVDAGDPPAGDDNAEAFEVLKQHIGFDDRDTHNLRTVADAVGNLLPGVLEFAHERILSFPEARRSISAGSEEEMRLGGALDQWVRSLFCGTYDERYLRRRVRIGQAQVEVALPQRFIVAAMEVVRQELERSIRANHVPGGEEALVSLRKLLALESAIMFEGYQGASVELVRENERSAVRERLTQAEHLAEIGRLAASLAHEIKNPLAGISGAIQIIRESMEPEAPHRSILGEVLRQINRLDQTVKDLLVYARPVPPRFGDCEMNRVVEQLMTALQTEPAMRRVRFDYIGGPMSLPRIEADENQIEQLLMNLILNAAHASDDGNLVTLTARHPRDNVELEVADRGHGMDELTRQQALEPFFTTKARGTGLGLPICRRIAEAHGGTLGITSAVGKGTTVRVRLPLRQAAPAREWR